MATAAAYSREKLVQKHQDNFICLPLDWIMKMFTYFITISCLLPDAI